MNVAQYEKYIMYTKSSHFQIGQFKKNVFFALNDVL